jgi:hypothetical protein
VPGFLLDAVATTVQITSADWSSTWTAAPGRSQRCRRSRVGGVLAIDPEPDMLSGTGIWAWAALAVDWLVPVEPRQRALPASGRLVAQPGR